MSSATADAPSWVEKNIMPTWKQLASMNRRQFFHQLFNLALVVCTALMIWQGLMVITGSESPVVVVLSGSMEPTFYKGDILTLYKDDSPMNVGDIVVFKIPTREIPIVHRVLEVHTRADGTQDILTKGDNNDSFDRPLYDGKTWINADHILGRVRGFMPYLGHVTIILTEFPLVKYLMLAVMGFFVITSQEG